MVQAIDAVVHVDWELMLRDPEIIVRKIVTARGQPGAGTALPVGHESH